jgi:hypothetical protein
MRLNYWGTRISLLWRMPLLTDSFEGSKVAHARSRSRRRRRKREAISAW